MYPPPPPPSSQPSSIKHEHTYHPSQPSMKTEAGYNARQPFNPYDFNPQIPYPVDASHHNRPSNDTQQGVKRPRIINRRPSEEEEREAGLALAGLGLSATSTPTNASTRFSSVQESETQGPSKKQRAKAVPKKNNERVSEPGKAQNACKECRRLKAKCDKQIPCSTCKLTWSLNMARADDRHWTRMCWNLP